MQKGLTHYQLKWIGIIFMVIDHVNTNFGAQLHWPLWVSLLARFVAPLFVFMMVEGFFYTRNRKKYASRLLIGGFAMLGINIAHNLLTHSTFTHPITGQFDPFLVIQGNNIFLTLAWLFLFIWSIDTCRKQTTWSRKLGFASLALLLIPLILFSEGGPYELILALIFYFFRGNLKRISLAILTFSALLFIHAYLTYAQGGNGTFYQVFTFDNEYMIATVLPFLYVYNGKLGGRGTRFDKQFFYYFYPVHLVVIYIIKAFVG